MNCQQQGLFCQSRRLCPRYPGRFPVLRQIHGLLYLPLALKYNMQIMRYKLTEKVKAAG